MNDQIQIVDIQTILTNPFQPRTNSFEEEKLQELAQTIKEVGLFQPPLVRQLEGNLFELIAGERRYRAAKMAGLTQIPVIVRSLTDQQSSLSAIIENIQRVDLNPIELAVALNNLSKELSLTQEQLSEAIGLKRSSIANHLRLLSLPKKIQQALIDEQITLGHAKVILSLTNEQSQLQLTQMIIRSNLSVRDTELKAQKMGQKASKADKVVRSSRNVFIEQIKDILQKKLGTRVEFSGNEKKGSIELHYYSLSDLNRLLQKLGYTEE